MTALRCTQKLLTAMKVAPSAPPAPGANRLGDWSLNLLHTRPKLVVAISEHDRLGLVLEAAPFATLPQRFIEALFVQLLAIGGPPDLAQRECEAMQPLTLTATTPYANRLSLQANLKDYAWLAELMWSERDQSLAEINARLADNLVSINGKLEFPWKFALHKLTAQYPAAMVTAPSKGAPRKLIDFDPATLIHKDA
ncbi:MAG: hypothetical protein HYU79_02845 [Nitrosomonadales bacterium]|nr:hypothetical protein [Nitrosomonadales bacterium]